jgi:hypothetical protein
MADEQKVGDEIPDRKASSESKTSHSLSARSAGLRERLTDAIIRLTQEVTPGVSGSDLKGQGVSYPGVLPN